MHYFRAVKQRTLEGETKHQATAKCETILTSSEWAERDVTMSRLLVVSKSLCQSYAVKPQGLIGPLTLCNPLPLLE